MIKKRGLGRNLEDLLGPKKNTILELSRPLIPTKKSELQKLPIEFLQRGKYQPRVDMDPEALEELAGSIRVQGIIQPIVVRPISENKYEIIAGERRWRAAQLAGLTEISALVREIPDDAAIAMSLIENIQRENLNAIEEANALKRLMDEFQLTHEEVADAVGKSRVTITNTLRLLNLVPEVKRMLEHGDLEMGHARAILTLDDHLQSQAAHNVVEKKLSVRETENLARRLKEGIKPKQNKFIDPDIRKLQEELSEKLGSPITIQHTAKGKGKLIIYYHSLNALDGILKKIG